MKNKSTVILVAIIALLVGGGSGFFGGMKYQQSKLTAARGGNFAGIVGGARGARGAGNGAGGANFRPVSGDIIAADDKSITVKMTDGTSRIVLFANSMTISKSSDASKSDLTVGQKVAVFGMQNSDGSVTAQNIQLNPITRIAPSPTPGM